MHLAAIVGSLEGCPFSELNDSAFIERVLRDAVAAGALTILHLHVHKFTPQGVTASALLSESHLALHSWPEDGILFLDIATCSGEKAATAAFEHICAAVPHKTVTRQDFRCATSS